MNNINDNHIKKLANKKRIGTMIEIIGMIMVFSTYQPHLSTLLSTLLVLGALTIAVGVDIYATNRTKLEILGKRLKDIDIDIKTLN